MFGMQMSLDWYFFALFVLIAVNACMLMPYVVSTCGKVSSFILYAE